MAIAVDGSPVSSGVRDGNSTATMSVTVNSSNSVIVVGVASRDTTDTDRVVSSVTYGGSSTGWAEIRSDTETATSNMSTSLWRCVNPATGTADVVVTMAGVCDRLAAGSLVLTGVDTGSPVDTSNGATSVSAGADPSVALTLSAADCYAVDVYYDTANDSGVSIGAGQTQIFKSGVNAGGDSAGGSYEGPVSTSVTMSWTNDASGAGFSITAAAFAPAAGGGSTITWVGYIG